MKQILDKVNEIAEVLNDTNGVTNVEWVKNNVNELQDIVKEICNLPFVSQQRELLISFFNWYQDNQKELSNNETIVDAYLEEINCG